MFTTLERIFKILRFFGNSHYRTFIYIIYIVNLQQFHLEISFLIFISFCLVPRKKANINRRKTRGFSTFDLRITLRIQILERLQHARGESNCLTFRLFLRSVSWCKVWLVSSRTTTANPESGLSKREDPFGNLALIRKPVTVPEETPIENPLCVEYVVPWS